MSRAAGDVAPFLARLAARPEIKRDLTIQAKCYIFITKC